MPATMPGTPAIVSRTTALWPYLFAKNVSAMKRKNFVIDNAMKSPNFDIFLKNPF